MLINNFKTIKENSSGLGIGEGVRIELQSSATNETLVYIYYMGDGRYTISIAVDKTDFDAIINFDKKTIWIKSYQDMVHNVLTYNNSGALDDFKIVKSNNIRLDANIAASKVINTYIVSKMDEINLDDGLISVTEATVASFEKVVAETVKHEMRSIFSKGIKNPSIGDLNMIDMKSMKMDGGVIATERIRLAFLMNKFQELLELQVLKETLDNINNLNMVSRAQRLPIYITKPEEVDEEVILFVEDEDKYIKNMLKKYFDTGFLSNQIKNLASYLKLIRDNPEKVNEVVDKMALMHAVYHIANEYSVATVGYRVYSKKGYKVKKKKVFLDDFELSSEEKLNQVADDLFRKDELTLTTNKKMTSSSTFEFYEIDYIGVHKDIEITKDRRFLNYE